MASPRHSARTREAALRRLSTLNRLAAVGAVCLTLGFTALAARATPPQGAAAPAPATAPALSAPRSEDDDDRSAPAPAPAPTQQPPVAVSGGS